MEYVVYVQSTALTTVRNVTDQRKQIGYGRIKGFRTIVCCQQLLIFRATQT